MDLKSIISKTNSKAIYLINEDGNILDFYSKENQSNTLKDKTAAFNTAIFNMSSHFLNTFYNAELNEIILKSNTQNIILIKHKQYIIALLSDENLNISLIELILKKEFNH
ncbi:roadblock/LC7 domain-containing protein [Tenacibaculum piscium]|uniref:roadblock/LC7 domain-containing protein n=1 Tax=Tenacibaculum piscium TaxID=1458515 RepID=UPI001F3D4866|nr:roadblock/LC7 domain-containing protein [Tenacibaculum piscium]